jgi:hypothetical protein
MLTLSVAVFQELSLLDRLLTTIILLSMIVGVLIGVYVDGVQEAFDVVQLHDVSVRTCGSLAGICRQNLTYAYSHCHWTPCHDVANSDEGALRKPSTALQINEDVEAHLYLPSPKLDHWTACHVWYGMGNTTGFANLSHWYVDSTCS